MGAGGAGSAIQGAAARPVLTVVIAAGCVVTTLLVFVGILLR